MAESSARLLAGLDANVFLAVLIPEATKAPKDEIAGATRVLRALEDGRLRGISTTILLGEIRYVYLREDKVGFEIARAAIEAESHLRLQSVSASLAIQAAELRRKYYSKKNAFSYNDGLYLATGLAEHADLLITTDPHLLNVTEIKNAGDIERTFDDLKRSKVHALLMPGGPVMAQNSRRLAELCAQLRLPAMYGSRQFVEDGGLMSYGVNFADLYYRAATYIDKILKGRKPADLPVEQPMKFELVVNLKTAKQIGATIAPNVLARADRVIR